MGLKKIPGLKRINVTLDAETLESLDWLADDMVRGNRSRAIRDAVAEAVERRIRMGSGFAAKSRRRSAVR